MLTQCVTPKIHTHKTQVWLKICGMTVESEGGGGEEEKKRRRRRRRRRGRVRRRRRRRRMRRRRRRGRLAEEPNFHGSLETANTSNVAFS